MPTYDVELIYTTSTCKVVTVEANSIEEAIDKADEEACLTGHVFTLDDFLDNIELLEIQEEDVTEVIEDTNEV